ncbi:MAG: hypothetical protein M3068_01070 [Gemmatimonadota bacterium]|nr:hypothetical protein [Gemmatimonadota bacterium]
MTAAEAQGTPLKRASPLGASARAAPCPPIAAPSPPTAAQRAQARDLAARAQQAAIIGDAGAARDLFRQAERLNGADASVAYELARLSDAARDSRAAFAEYCRFLVLAPTAPEASEARERVAMLGVAAGEIRTTPAAAEREFRTGIAAFDRHQLVAAEAAFSRAIELAPAWPEAYFDRASVLAAEARPDAAVRDLESYLRLRPEADDRAEVVQRIELLQRSLLHPSEALVRGLLVPGLGQFYTRRPALGVVVLGSVAGALAYGLRSTSVTTTRTAIDPNGYTYQYPHTEATRAHLAAGLGVAGGVALIAAVEAWVHARSGVQSAGR